MKRLLVIAASAAVLAACTPSPAGGGNNPSTPVLQPSGEMVAHWTDLGELNIYRASLTSLVVGPVELCLGVTVARNTEPPSVENRCRTLFVVPGGQVSEEFRVEDGPELRPAVLRLDTITSSVAFIGTLDVVQGEPLRPCGSYCGDF